MGAWATTLDPTGKSGIRFLADPHSELTSALDLSFDGAAIFGNARSKRYALVVENGKVTKAFVEPDNTGLDGMLSNFSLLLCRIQHHSEKPCHKHIANGSASKQSALPKRSLAVLRSTRSEYGCSVPTRLVHTEQTRVRQSIELDSHFNPYVSLADRASRYVTFGLDKIECGVSRTIVSANLICITG